MKLSKNLPLFFATALTSADAVGSLRGQGQRQLVSDPSPLNQYCLDAEPISVGDSLIGSTFEASNELGTFNLTGTTINANATFENLCGVPYLGAPGVWYKVTGNGNDLLAETLPADFDTTIHVFTGDCDSLTCQVANDDSAAFAHVYSQVRWQSQVDVEYYVFVSGFGSSRGNFKLTLAEYNTDPPSNDNACSAAPVSLLSPRRYNNAFASAQEGEINPGNSSLLYFNGTGYSCLSQDGWCSFDTEVDNSVWFEFTPERDGCVDIFTNNFADLQLALWQADDCADFETYTEIAANDDGFYFAPRIRYSRVEEGLKYLIQLDGYNGTINEGYLVVGRSVDTTAPEAECFVEENPFGAAVNDPVNSAFYKITGVDDCSDPQLFVIDEGSDEHYGPFESGTLIQYINDPTAVPSILEVDDGMVFYQITGTGEAKVVGVDKQGNTGLPSFCPSFAG